MWLLIIPATVFGEEAALQFEQANQDYRSGDFKEAAKVYEAIARSGYENPMLEYNLGNAYFKLQDIPSAILHFERAKRLAPHDDDILYNLRLANLRVTDKIEPVPRLFFEEWWRSAMSLFSADSWSLIGICGLWLTAVGAGVFIVSRSYLLRKTTFLVTLLLAAATLVSYVGMFEQLHREESEQHAIIFSPSVAVKSAPDAQSVDLFVLHEGVNVELLDAVGEWGKIRLADGKVGWLLSSSVQVI